MSRVLELEAEEELEPAEICTPPPLPADEDPPIIDREPAEPPDADPVDTTTDPETPLLEDVDAPLTRDRLPEAPEGHSILPDGRALKKN